MYASNSNYSSEEFLQLVPKASLEKNTQIGTIRSNSIPEIFIKSFISNLSHEIRTPLNAIVGFSSLICDEKLSNNDKMNYAKEVELNSSDLINSIENILEFSLLETNNYNLFYEFFSVDEVIEEVYNNLESMNKNQCIASIKRVPSEVKSLIIFSDRQILVKILNHILSNALKFTKYGRIEIVARLIDNKLLIEVCDTGVGIATDELNSIFKPFQKKKNTLYRGMGLGLAISRKLSEIIEAEIMIESNIEKGSKLSLSIAIS